MGQAGRQSPSPSQKFSRISFAFPFMISMAPSWQALAHSPQPLHRSSSMTMIFLSILSLFLPPGQSPDRSSFFLRLLYQTELFLYVVKTTFSTFFRPFPDYLRARRISRSIMDRREDTLMSVSGSTNISKAVMRKSVRMSMASATDSASAGMPIWANRTV